MVEVEVEAWMRRGGGGDLGVKGNARFRVLGDFERNCFGV